MLTEASLEIKPILPGIKKNPTNKKVYWFCLG